MMKPFMQQISQLSGAADRLTASASVPADSIWYSGHFPGTPLLPGIAILALVKEAISGRVRFRLPVRPDDRMVIEIAREKKGAGFAYGFSVFLSEELACTGVLAARVVAR